MTTAVYAGSFDPVTRGHLDLILRAADTFDKVIVGIGVNSSKKPTFPLQERQTMIQESLTEVGNTQKNITVVPFEGLLVDFCRQHSARVIVRGLRAVMDFEAEMTMAHANMAMTDRIEVFFMPTKPEFSFVSSSTVRAIASHKSEAGWGSLPKYVTNCVLNRLLVLPQR